MEAVVSSLPNTPALKTHDDEGDGECFANSFYALRENPEWTLVHGWMKVSAGVIQEFELAHAWLECTLDGETWCYDPAYPGRKETAPKEHYYKMKRITRPELNYAASEARQASSAAGGDLGPWHTDYKKRAHAANDAYDNFTRQQKD